jgi:hypothetical protein
VKYLKRTRRDPPKSKHEIWLLDQKKARRARIARKRDEYLGKVFRRNYQNHFYNSSLCMRCAHERGHFDPNDYPREFLENCVIESDILWKDWIRTKYDTYRNKDD